MTQHRWIRNFPWTREIASGLLVACMAMFTLCCIALAGVTVASEQHTSMPRLRVLIQGTLATPHDGALFIRTLSAHSGVPMTLVRSPNALAHWRGLQAGSRVDLVLEEAQFVDYRAREHGFAVLARARRDDRFAVIAAPGSQLHRPSDLRGRRLAVEPPPALAALRVLELFPDPMLEPTLIPLGRETDILGWVLDGRVDAAMVPLELAQAVGARMVVLSNASPGPGVSAAPGMDPARRLLLAYTLTRLVDTALGRRALRAVGLAAFDFATYATYDGASGLLRRTWRARGHRLGQSLTPGASHSCEACYDQ